MTKDSKVSKAYNDIWATCPDVYKLIVDKDKDRKHFVEGSQINRVFRAVLTFDHLRNELLPSSKILDIGCGLGFNTCYLSTLGFDVNGFDASEVGIERSKKLAIFLGLDPEIFVCANHNYLESIESDSVDAVIGMGFIYYLNYVLGYKKKPSFWSLLSKLEFNRMIFVYPNLVYKTRKLLWFYSFISLLIRKRQPKRAFRDLWQVISFYAKGGARNIEKVEYKSLRRTVEKDFEGPYQATPEMVELRRGR